MKTYKIKPLVFINGKASTWVGEFWISKSNRKKGLIFDVNYGNTDSEYDFYYKRFRTVDEAVQFCNDTYEEHLKTMLIEV